MAHGQRARCCWRQTEASTALLTSEARVAERLWTVYKIDANGNESVLYASLAETTGESPIWCDCGRSKGTFTAPR